MRTYALLIAATATLAASALGTFPDGTPVEPWFDQAVELPQNAKRFVITDFGVANGDSTLLQTAAIQAVIDKAAEAAPAQVVIPRGTFLSGSLFFRPGTSLVLEEGARLKGSDAIGDYDIIDTRLEGRTIRYFAALVNAIGCDGFSISGSGTIDGNGTKFYHEFWLRRRVNPDCTNLEALRPRMLYVANSKDISVSGITMLNSGFWTNHLYNCQRIKYEGVTILAPTRGYPKGPSTDAIDLDACQDVAIRRCHMDVNDDAVCLKGGKGTYVDTIAGNGPCRNVIISDCSFGLTNAGVTFGSEAWDCKNVVLRNCTFAGTSNVLLFKMRPDTPQQYRHVLIDGVSGSAINGVTVQTWTQFFDKADRDPMPPSEVANVTTRNVSLSCREFFHVDSDPNFSLSHFTFENVDAEAANPAFDITSIPHSRTANVNIAKANK